MPVAKTKLNPRCLQSTEEEIDLIQRWEDYFFMHLFEYFEQLLWSDLLNEYHARSISEVFTPPLHVIHVLQAQINSHSQVTLEACRKLLQQSPDLMRIFQVLSLEKASMALSQIHIILDLSGMIFRKSYKQNKRLIIVRHSFASGQENCREWGQCVRVSPLSDPQLIQALDKFSPAWDIFSCDGGLEHVEFYDVIQWLKASSNPRSELIDHSQCYLDESRRRSRYKYSDNQLEKRWQKHLERETYFHRPSQKSDKEVIQCWEHCLAFECYSNSAQKDRILKGGSAILAFPLGIGVLLVVCWARRQTRSIVEKQSTPEYGGENSAWLCHAGIWVSYKTTAQVVHIQTGDGLIKTIGLLPVKLLFMCGNFTDRRWPSPDLPVDHEDDGFSDTEFYWEPSRAEHKLCGDRLSTTNRRDFLPYASDPDSWLLPAHKITQCIHILRGQTSELTIKIHK
ncbi:hypothetical protein B0H14DRAFT_2571443 [Mycena olivaceomarginata]|nr:hypothetical protein B0H14DRAFT_2571443 [Mycena olivaceomarginata]